MLLQNEQLELIDPKKLKEELLKDFKNTDLVDEESIENDLAHMYLSASNATASLYYTNEKIADFASNRALAFSFPLAGKNILGKIRDFICKFLNEGSTASDIIDAILEAIASIIPGGVIIKGILKKLIRFILNKGIGSFCKVQA